MIRIQVWIYLRRRKISTLYIWFIMEIEYESHTFLNFIMLYCNATTRTSCLCGITVPFKYFISCVFDDKAKFMSVAWPHLVNILCVNQFRNRLHAVLKPTATKLALCLSKNLPHQNRFCIDTKPAFSFWINNSIVSEVRCDCQGLGLVARIAASILVFDTMQVLYWPVLGQIQFCSLDRRCKTCLDTKPVLYQDRFCSLTDVRPLSE